MAAGLGLLKTEAARGAGARVLLMDSISMLEPADRGAIVVAASHGGISSGQIALTEPLALVFFNDAGIGKDGAGVAALALLQSHGVAAGAVAHTSARIGDARDMWAGGLISHLNAAASALGLEVGLPLQAALLDLLRR